MTSLLPDPSGPAVLTHIQPRRPNIYTGSPLDRSGHLRDDAAWLAAALASSAAVFVPVWRSKSLLRALEGGSPEAVYLERGLLPAGPAGEPSLPWAFLGMRGEAPVFAVDLSAADDTTPFLGGAEHAAFADLRTAAGALPAADAPVLAHARGLMHWRARHGFCGNCGHACTPRSAGHVMHCANCDTSHFPRTDPAVIMLVTTGERALLGHSARFPSTTMYSALAGFVEPGESLEEAVAREVFEESGIRVGRVAYHSSQPWPFPASIMLGFYADALTDAITLDDDELLDARWFTRAELRAPDANGFQLPRGDSIARRLIEDWIAAA